MSTLDVCRLNYETGVNNCRTFYCNRNVLMAIAFVLLSIFTISAIFCVTMYPAGSNGYWFGIALLIVGSLIITIFIVISLIQCSISSAEKHRRRYEEEQTQLAMHKCPTDNDFD